MVKSYTQRFFAILTILREETDADHPMDAAAIAKALESKYAISMDPRSIVRAIEEIRKADYPVEDGWYYRAELTREELIYLSDLTAMGTGLTESARRTLLKKLEDMGGRYFTTSENHEFDRVGNDNFLNTLYVLHDAIASGNRVSFHYGNYDVDGELHPRENRVHRPKEYMVDPYAVVMNNGRYYLLAITGKHVNIAHYRVDRIMDIRKCKAHPRIDPEIDLKSYAAEHPYMYAGEVQEFRLHIQRQNLNQVFDFFGPRIQFENTTPQETDVIVRSDPISMEHWLRRFNDIACIISE